MRQLSQNKFIESAANYGFGAASVAAALSLNLLLDNWMEPRATPLFLAAVAVTAWRGGKYPSLFATALAVFSIDYFFQTPLRAFEASVENVVNTVVFVLVALLISWIDAERKNALRERNRLLTSERQARAAAENANRAKDVFLAMVTHELRSPLNAILGWTQVMRKNKLDAAKTEHALTVIERNSQLQKQLIEDLLDISRVRAGNFRINPRPVALQTVIEAAVETVAPAIAAKRIKLHREFDGQIGQVNADPERLQQVVWNLLSNAVKFTPEEGQIGIRLECAGKSARLGIYDTGAGIGKEFLPHVFDHYRQADETDQAKHKGLGLGLAIVRHLVEAHGGTVAAASAGKNLGATFTVELPLLPVSEAQSAEQTAGGKDVNLEYV
jgi:signal transduction histidine kinase